MRSRSSRVAAYCMKGTYEGACRVKLQPGRPSFSAAARGLAITSAGMPESSRSSSMRRETHWWRRAGSRRTWRPARASSSWIWLEARLLRFGAQLGAGEAEIAHLVVDDLALRAALARRTRRPGWHRLVLGEQVQVLPLFGVEEPITSGRLAL